MSKLSCICGSENIRIKSERDTDGFGEFIWAQCSDCGLKGREKFVSERCPQSNQECFDEFSELIKPFEQLQQRVGELEYESGCKCQSCGQKYLTDLIVSDELWEKIKPDGKPVGSGLLCPQCIWNRTQTSLAEVKAEAIEDAIDSVADDPVKLRYGDGEKLIDARKLISHATKVRNGEDGE